MGSVLRRAVDRNERFSSSAGARGAKRVRVLIVDDSRIMRVLLAGDPAIEIVGAAADAYEAQKLVKALAPDVLTLDIEMPRMDGVTFLKHLMANRPTPVVMVSAFTRPGAAAAVRALAAGAFDCVEKPSPSNPDALDQLPRVVLDAARSRTDRRRAGPAAPSAGCSAFVPKPNAFVMIGASTGGVEALRTVLSAFPENCPPTMIVQHMPEAFTQGFAGHLDDVAAPSVRLATDGAQLRRGEVLLAPGGAFHLLMDPEDRSICRLREGPRVEGHRPSVDALFTSAVPFARFAAAALLTGIGGDGAAGLAALRAGGCATFAQDEESSVVYGMPRVALELGAVDKPTPLAGIGAQLISACAAGSPAVAGGAANPSTR